MSTANPMRIPAAYDFHIHLREGALLPITANAAAQQFAAVMAMPNLKTPITTVAQALAYQASILRAVTLPFSFTPYVTLYLTKELSAAEIQAAANSQAILACKLYPKNATTQSQFGVEKLEAIYPQLEAMEKHQLVLAVHGEVTDPAVDIFDREAVFIEKELLPIRKRFPQLRIVLEHITTKAAVDFVHAAGHNTAATITVHHLLLNRNALFEGGLRPHHYCLPVLKREVHRQALQQAALSGNPQFFLGTDSAPHYQHLKESACGCAGIYSTDAAMPLLAQFFTEAQAFEKLADFTSAFGAQFYGIAPSTAQAEIHQTPCTIPATIETPEGKICPFWGGKTIPYRYLRVAK